MEYTVQKSMSDEEELPLHEMASSVGLRTSSGVSILVARLLGPLPLVFGALTSILSLMLLAFFIELA